MALISNLLFCTLLLISSSVFGGDFGDEFAREGRLLNEVSDENNKLRCFVQDPERTAKSLPRNMSIPDALEAIKSDRNVEDCDNDATYCFEMKGCGVFINGTDFALHNAGRRGCLTEDVSELLLSQGLCSPDNNCLECRVCRGDECNQQWFDKESTTPPTTTAPTTSTTTESTATQETNVPRIRSTSQVPESTAAPASGSLGTAPVSAMMALLGLLTLGAVVF